MFFFSWRTSSGSDSTLSARWCNVRTTDSLWSRGWFDSKSKYWSVWGGFLYTLTFTFPSCCLTVKVSRMAHTSSLKIRRYWIEIKLEDTQILDRDLNWFTGGAREAICIRAHKPTLNRDGGRYNLPAIWHRLICLQVTWPVKSHQQWSRLQLEPIALNRTSSCVVSKIYNFWFFEKIVFKVTNILDPKHYNPI